MTIESTAIRDRQLISEVSARNIEAFGDLETATATGAYDVACSVCRDDGRAPAHRAGWVRRRLEESNKLPAAAGHGHVADGLALLDLRAIRLPSAGR